jgi:hypothetical protein
MKRLALGAIGVAGLLASVPASAADPFRSAGRVGPGQSLASGVTFRPRVEGALYYFDNLNTVEDEVDQVNSAAVEVAPGFYAAYQSPRATAAIDYSLIGRWYEEEEFDRATHRLAANGRWNAIESLLNIDAQASYSDALIDPLRSADYGSLGVYGSGNSAEVATASVTPRLRKAFNDWVFRADYGYARTWYLDVETNENIEFQDRDNTTDQSAYVSVANDARGNPLTFLAYYQNNRSQFRSDENYKFEKAAVELGWRLSSSLRTFAEVGMESDLFESRTDGGLENTYWYVGGEWRPDQQTRLYAKYGERFFGSAYYLDASRQARFLRVSASYSEEPGTERGRRSLGDFTPGELPPGDPGPDYILLDSSPYVLRYSSLTLSSRGLRTDLSLTGYQRERDYIGRGVQTERTTGARFGASRSLSAKLNGSFGADYSEFGRTSGSLVEDDREITNTSYSTTLLGRLTRRLGERTSSSFEAAWFNRSGFEDYDGWWVALRLRYEM